MTRSRSRLVAVAIYLLVALALPLETSEPIHVHHGDVPGLYNGECLLATLAVFHGVGLLPAEPSAVSLGLVVGPAVAHAFQNPACPFVSNTDSRGPPLA